MNDPYYSADLTAVTADLNADGVVESLVADYNADGYSDVLATDTNGDGMVDAAVLDSDYDGSADTLLISDAAPVEVPVSTSDAEATDDPYPVTDFTESTPNPSSGIYGVSSDTQAVMDMVGTGLKDASTLYRDALDPGSVSSDEVAAASERIDNAAQNSRALEGHIYEQEIANEIRSDELTRQSVDQARQTATDVWIESERAISRANDAL